MLKRIKQALGIGGDRQLNHEVVRFPHHDSEAVIVQRIETALAGTIQDELRLIFKLIEALRK